MATALSAPPSAVTEGRVVYDSNPNREGWIVATFGEGEDLFVGIRWKLGRLRPGVVLRDTRQGSDWFFVPRELGEIVLERAEKLKAEREEAIRRSYEEQAADEEAEREAIEWIESHVGECL